MTRGVNRVGQRVDKFLVVEITSERRSDGTYVLHEGRLLKNVEHYTVLCPECGVAAYYDEHSDPICPTCGMVCQDGEEKFILPVDESWPSRCNGGPSGFPAINDAPQRTESHADRRARFHNDADAGEAVV